MNVSEYSKLLYTNMSELHNPGHFVSALFNAAGSTFFSVHGSYGADDHQRNGSRVFHKKMQARFPSPINEQGLAVFFDTHIGDTSPSFIMVDFAPLICRVLSKN